MEDWEDEPVPQIVNKDPVLSNWDDEDVDDDDVKESWEDDDEPAPAPAPAKAPEKPAKKAASKESGKKGKEVADEILLDPVEEKLRQQRKVKEDAYYVCPHDKAFTFELIKDSLGHVSPGCIFEWADDTENFSQVFELEQAAYLIPYHNLFTEMKKLMLIDDKDQFASFLKANHDLLLKYSPIKVLHLLCSRNPSAVPVGCLTALLESPLRVHIDINVAYVSGFSPLHFAARKLSYAMTELLLHHGADIEPDTGYSETPLREALSRFNKHRNFSEDWTAEKSILKLLHFYCLPESKEPLDVVRLLASHTNTKKLDDLCMELMIIRYVKEYAALLMAAWDKIMVSSPNTNRGLVNTPVWQHITRVLNNPSLQQEICEGLYNFSKERLVTNLSIALDVVKTMWMTVGVLERYYHQRVEIGEMKELSFHVTYELVTNARLDLKPDGANLLGFLPMLTSEEAKVLPERKFYVEPQQAGPKSRSFVGKLATGSFVTPPLPLMSRFQYRKLNILNPMGKHLCRTAQVRPLSHNNVLACAKVCAPLMWFAKRSVK